MRLLEPVLYLARRAWAFAAGRRGLVVTYLIMFLAAVAVSLIEPLVIARLIDALQVERDTPRLLAQVRACALAYFVLQLLFWVFHGPARVLERWVAFHVRAAYRTRMFRQGVELPLGWHKDHHSGENIDKINRASGALYEFTGQTFELIYMFARFAGSLAILLWVMPAAGVAVALTTAVVLALIVRFDRRLEGQYGTLNGCENRVAAAVHDYFTNIGTVITLRLQAPTVREVVRRIGLGLPTYRSNIVINEMKWFATNMLIGAMVAAVTIAWAYRTVAAGQVLMGGALFSLFEYLRRIGDSFYQFAANYGTVVRQAADVRSAATIEDAHAELEGEIAVEAPARWKTIHVRGLNFTHRDDRDRTHHLADVGLELARGTSVALVGASGSGKSTLMALLRGLHRPERADVSVDGVPAGQALGALAGCTTLMPQDPEIFADTIRFNITFGLEVPDEEVLRAMRLARFEPVLRRLPKGLDTHIAEKGVNLSGGEKQRLALARGVFFARESDVVLLDEPTSSVDALNERLIYSALLREWRDKCVVSSIHRLHLLPMFDRVYVLEDGRVVESGTSDELLRGEGTLAGLYASYAGGAGGGAVVTLME